MNADDTLRYRGWHFPVSEMAKLVCSPGMNFDHFGDAHADGFSNSQEKLREKLRLFDHTEAILADIRMNRFFKGCIPTALHRTVVEASGWSGRTHLLTAVKSEPSAFQAELNLPMAMSILGISLPGEAALANAALAVMACLQLGLTF